MISLVFLMYPSLNYATGEDNSCTEALGKAFFSLPFASVCATGLKFPLFPGHANTEYSWTKNCFYIITLAIFLFILKSCTYSVLSWYPLPKHVFCMRHSCLKQCQQDGGVVDLGVETCTLHVRYTRLLLALTLVEMICLHLSIE